VIVVDASVMAPALADDGHDGHIARMRLRDEELSAPELIDLEVVSVWRGQSASGSLDPRRAELALRDLQEIPLRRAPHRYLLSRCWELRSNLTVYDASYVALAEMLGVVLLTADAKLARTPGVRCDIDVIDSHRSR
jgi:predicted nucleic acid-binding protein